MATATRSMGDHVGGPMRLFYLVALRIPDDGIEDLVHDFLQAFR